MNNIRQIFAIPDPMYSYQQFIRFHHLDITDLSEDELQNEFFSLRSQLYRLPPDKVWIKKRVRELGKEIARRHYNTTTTKEMTKIISVVPL